MSKIDDNWDSSDDSDVVSEPMLNSKLLCLFCTAVQTSISATDIHLKDSHKFDLQSFLFQHKIDSYDWIRFVNFVRKHPIVPPSLFSLPESCRLWKDEGYLKPAHEDDELLMLDVEYFTNNNSSALCEVASCPAHCEQGNNEESVPALKAFYLEMKNERDNAVEAVAQLKEALRNVVCSQSDSAEGSSRAADRVRGSTTEDEAYFGGYAHFSIHQTMLQDRARTEAYRDFITTASSLFQNSVVLDVGCGSAILSMFCARAGAKQVIAVDKSDIIFDAIDIVMENQLSDKIFLKHTCIEDIDQLPAGVQQVDIIISEWMGYFLFFESMLDSVIFAREKFLKPGGLIFPNKYRLYLCGVGDEFYHDTNVKYWDDVYGFKMSCFKKSALTETLQNSVPGCALITESTQVYEIDINNCESSCQEFSSEFELVVLDRYPKDLVAICGYFDAEFAHESVSQSILLSTSPQSEATHWKQSLFLLDPPVPVNPGDILTGTIRLERMQTDGRSYTVHLDVAGQRRKYYLGR